MRFLDDKVVIFLLWNPPGLHVWLRFFFYWCSHAMSLVDWFSRKRDLQRISATSELRSDLGFFSMICLFACASPFLFLFWIVMLWSWLYITVLVGLLFFGCGLLLLEQLWWGVLFCFLVSLSFMFLVTWGLLLGTCLWEKIMSFEVSFVVIMHLLM